MIIYTAASGEMFDAVSYACYGTEKYTAELIKANIAYRGCYRFAGGEKLIVPDVDTMTDKAVIRPPWMGAVG